MTKASIIIVSKNNEREILDILKLLSLQDFKDFEVIIIDLCSTDQTLINVKHFPVKAFRLESGEKNLPRALNLGSKICLGEIIFSLAGKNIPKYNCFISSGLKALKNPKAALVYGPKIVEDEAPIVKILKVGGFNKTNQEMKGANLDVCAYKKQIWQKINFPENDESAIWEWSTKIIDLGFQIKFNPQMAASSKEKTGLLYYLKEELKKNRQFNDFQKRTKERVKR
ncbi:glycosyltransferase [Patescibacteria group bacterium]|nr:glycosyltransferase [Patescibacteria group bacterium]